MESVIKREFSKNNLISIFSKYGIIIAFGLIILILSFATNEFFTVYNIINILRQSSIIGIVAIGMALMIIMGGIDLSVGSLLALSGVVAGMVAHPDLGAPVILAVLAGIGVGALSGAFIGTCVAWGNIEPFIVTLGMMTISRGIAMILSHGIPVTGLNPAFTKIGSGKIAGIPYTIIIYIFVLALATLILKRTKFGRQIYAIGGNEEAAKVAGINIRLTKLKMFILLGCFTGLAGILLAGRIRSGSPSIANGYELDAIASCVIGGISFTGGIGTAFGAFIGTLIISTINNGLDLLNVQAFYQQVVKGLIIILAVLIDSQKSRLMSK